MKASQPLWVFLLVGLSVWSRAGEPQRAVQPQAKEQDSRVRQSVTGPVEPINRAVAAGATAIMTLQPVPPTTDPPTNYPPGSAIMGQRLILGSVPARVWIEFHATGWAPELLKNIAGEIDALDLMGDGGGYLGSNATCNGMPVNGAGDIMPALQSCPSANITGHTVCSAAFSAEFPCSPHPSRCVSWDGVFPDYFPAGLFCQPGFQNPCQPRWSVQGVIATCAFDMSTLNFAGGCVADPGEAHIDFMPSYLWTIVLDVPADANGEYRLDFNAQGNTFMHNPNPPGQNSIPIAELRSAVIKVPMCSMDADCSDNNICTIDTCVDGCCANTPIAGWDPQTECCNPMSGAQGLIPTSTPCRTGTCSDGGSVGVPTYVNRPNGTACTSIDPCYGQGSCQDGSCASEQYAGPDCPKVRFISFDAGADSTPKAWRIRMVSLHHPDPPYAGAATADFSAHEGEVRWVGPPTSYVESTSNPTTVFAAVTQCPPHYQDWTGYDLLHVTGGEIVPSSEYQVQSIEQGLDINNEANYSAPMTISTARWGDMVIPNAPPSTTIQPDAGDISAVLDKFRSTATASSKPRALMVGAGMDSTPSLIGDVTFSDISAVVDANRGLGYPYAWPMPCP